MNPAYFTRLACLSLAVLLLVQTMVGLGIRFLLPSIVNRARRMEPRRASRLFLVLGWIPTLVGLFLVLAVCIPSYLRFEPVNGTEEEVGWICSILAAACIVSYAVPTIREVYRVIRTESQLRALASGSDRVCVLENGGARMALAGLFEWRLLISKDVFQVLTCEEMAVALRHERAHQEFKDNFARVLIDAAPLCPGRGEIRVEWIRFTEWAADDWAVQHDAASSASLASALVRVARLNPAINRPLLESTLISTRPNDLRERVERLLAPPATSYELPSPLLLAIPVSVIVCAIFGQLANGAVHRCLELLIG